MTANQASPARAGLPAPRAATARPHDPAGHPAIGRRPADLLLMAARKKTALYAPLLLGGAAAAVLALALPAMASPVTGQAAASTGSISAILSAGDIVTGVRGTTGGDVILTGSHATGDGNNTLPFLYQGPLTSPAEDSGFHALHPPFTGLETGTFYGPNTSTYNPEVFTFLWGLFSRLSLTFWRAGWRCVSLPSCRGLSVSCRWLAVCPVWFPGVLPLPAVRRGVVVVRAWVLC